MAVDPSVRMPFGIHRGKSIDYIPRPYLEWLLYETDIEITRPNLFESILEQLAMRDRSHVED